MKLDVKPSFVKMEKESWDQLVTEVKETIAFVGVKPATKIFTAADLWSIQRQAKARLQRRFL